MTHAITLFFGVFTIAWLQAYARSRIKTGGRKSRVGALSSGVADNRLSLVTRADVRAGTDPSPRPKPRIKLTKPNGVPVLDSISHNHVRIIRDDNN